MDQIHVSDANVKIVALVKLFDLGPSVLSCHGYGFPNHWYFILIVCGEGTHRHINKNTLMADFGVWHGINKKTQLIGNVFTLPLIVVSSTEVGYCANVNHQTTMWMSWCYTTPPIRGD